MRSDLPRVLLVDDRPENLLALEAVLEPLPCELVSVTSGEAALKQLLTDEFAVALLDVQMPEMDGFETAELIKSRERTRALPIIFVTAISKERHHVFRGYSAGAVDYVLKPYDPGILRSKVSVFLELHAKSQAAARSEAVLQAAFDHAPIGLARMDLDARIADVNRALAELLGRPAAELQGRSFDSLLHADDAAPDAPWRGVLGAERLEGVGHELRLVTLESEEVPCDVRFSLARAQGLAADSLIVQVQDLRERRRAETEREQLIREQAARAQAERVSQRLQAVQTITDAALHPVSFDELIAGLLRRTADVLAVDAAAAVLYEEGGVQLVYNVAGGVESGLQVERGVVNAAAEDSGHPLGDSVQSVLAVPLLVRGRAIGDLHIGTLFLREFSAEDTAVLGLAADRAAMAIERARLYEHEHAIAQELQQSLLPEKLPLLPGVATAARYNPAGAGSQVGGDWYDVIVQPGGHLLLVIGDVAGRGIEAASTMGQLRSALRAYAFDGHGPGALLERMNAFQNGLPGMGMATVALVSVEPGGQTLRYAIAGHPPALLLPADGTPHWLDETLGLPLGCADDAVYQEAVAPLGPGATLVLYTDGLVEVPGEHLDRGLERLATAAQAGPAEAEPLCDAILAGTLLDPDVADDVTLVVLRTVGAEPSRLELTIPADPWALQAMRATTTQWLARASTDDTEIYEIVLALNEAVENSIEHGHRGSDRLIALLLEREDDHVRITIRDEGSWREADQSIEPGERGRGFTLMRAMMDEVTIDTDADGTAVVMRRQLRSPLGDNAAVPVVELESG